MSLVCYFNNLKNKRIQRDLLSKHFPNELRFPEIQTQNADLPRQKRRFVVRGKSPTDTGKIQLLYDRMKILSEISKVWSVWELGHIHNLLYFWIWVLAARKNVLEELTQSKHICQHFFIQWICTQPSFLACAVGSVPSPFAPSLEGSFPSLAAFCESQKNSKRTGFLFPFRLCSVWMLRLPSCVWWTQLHCPIQSPSLWVPSPSFAHKLPHGRRVPLTLPLT